MNQTPVKVRRKFDETFKREAVQNWRQSSKSAEVIAQELGINANRLYAWQKHFAPAPAGGSRGKVLLPGIEPVSIDPQFLRNHFRRFAALAPVLDRFTFEGFVEFTTGFDRCLIHGLAGSLFTQSFVRQFDSSPLRRPDLRETLFSLPRKQDDCAAARKI